MSDLVGNPEDRFSHVAAHITQNLHANLMLTFLLGCFLMLLLNEVALNILLIFPKNCHALVLNGTCEAIKYQLLIKIGQVTSEIFILQSVDEEGPRSTGKLSYLVSLQLG